MTNSKQVRNNKKRGGNRKDGHRPDRRQTKARRQAIENQWTAAGFKMTDWNKWTYTWPGESPVFRLTPGILIDDRGTHAGLIARYASADKKILFVYGTDPASIKARLDDEILAIMRLQADVDNSPIGGGQEIGPEINLDVWRAVGGG